MVAVSTFGGAVLGLVLWLVVYTLAHAALYLLDLSRGLDDDWLQIIFRELVTPGCGSYAAILCIRKFLPKANLIWAATLLCLPIVAFYICFTLYLIIFHRSDYEFSWFEQIFNWGIAVSTCVGSYLGVVQFGSD
ncbi:MAG: hypothetical protein OXU70_05775 [Gammaproteobacteria bacterium]|nr:hypothetical protein [Gammaproteobacteria bacterium]